MNKLLTAVVDLENSAKENAKQNNINSQLNRHKSLNENRISSSTLNSSQQQLNNSSSSNLNKRVKQRKFSTQSNQNGTNNNSLNNSADLNNTALSPATSTIQQGNQSAEAKDKNKKSIIFKVFIFLLH